MSGPTHKQMPMLILDQDAVSRFWGKVQICGHNECWPWLGNRSGNYGVFYYLAKRMRSTHISLVLSGNAWSPGLFACHRCDNPPCVNPAHLFWGTQKQNAEDMVFKGRSHHSQKTHCPHGHEYSGINLGYRKRDNSKVCRACHRERAARRNKIKREAACADL